MRGENVITHSAPANPTHWLWIVPCARAHDRAGRERARDTRKAVPTCNYSAMRLRGTVTVHDDVDWPLSVVNEPTG